MNSLKFKHVHMIQDMQLLLNFIIIIFNASIFLVATDYICNKNIICSAFTAKDFF